MEWLLASLPAWRAGRSTKCLSIGDEGSTCPRRGRDPVGGNLLERGNDGPSPKKWASSPIQKYWLWPVGKIEMCNSVINLSLSL